MIVMKFGGSSVGSPDGVKRVAAIVKAREHLQPVIVVSAFGDTTGQLTTILEHAASGESYLAWKQIKELREYHFALAEDLLRPPELNAVDRHLRETFRDLHVRMSEVYEGERRITLEETDSVLSLGEQLSSEIVCAALRQSGIPSCHMDARNLILTDSQFTSAHPRHWETYAKIRWTVPAAARKSVVVLGGFMGATEQGQTTTLGRGGSDLTATLIGAAINADEIQIWKDVDGILTADPRRRTDAWLVKSLSYQEAAELAKAGAGVLHPGAVAPAQRLRIPLTLRNTFNPQAPGTSICSSASPAPAKSIVCRSPITLLEISSARPDVSIIECSQGLNSLLNGRERHIEPLGMSASVLYLALESAAQPPELPAGPGACMQARLRTQQALITLVGEGVASDQQAVSRIQAVTGEFGASILPPDDSAISLRLVLPCRHLKACLDALHQAFFAAPDPAIFAKPSPSALPGPDKPHLPKSRDRAARIRQALTVASTPWALRN